MKLLARKNSLLLLSGVVLVALQLFANAAAAPAKDITVSPFLQSVQIEPSDAQKNFNLKLTNNTPSGQTFYLSAVDFGGLNETGGVLFEGSSSNALLKKYGLAKWISLPAPQVTLDGGKSANIEVSVKNDSTLQPGGHYGAIIFTSKNPSSTGGQVGVNQQISALIFATKKGGEKYDLHLDSVSSNKSLFKMPTEAEVRFKNTGNTQLVPRGVVSVKSGNKVLARGVINEQSSYVLPETHRVFEVALHPVEAHASLLAGSLTLQTDYRYDGYDRFASSAQSFLVLNLFAICVLLVLIPATLAVVKIKKRPIKKPRSSSSVSKIPVKTNKAKK